MEKGYVNGPVNGPSRIYGKININSQGPVKASESDLDASKDSAVADFDAPESGMDFSHLKGKDRVEAMKTELAEGMNNLAVDPEVFDSYIDFMRQSYTYSYNNTLLLMLQKPYQNNFKTYKQWAALGYQVSKGAKSASVLRPIIVADKDDMVTKADGTTEPKRKLVGYASYGVFSAQDLDASVKEPPSDPIGAHVDSYRKDGSISDNEVMRKDLEGVAADMGVEVIYASSKDDSMLSSSTGGYAMNAGDGKRRVVINTDFEQHYQTYTLAHEMGHVLCGHVDDTPEEGVSMHRPDREVEAESVAYGIARTYGLDAGNRAFAYLKGWADGDEKKITKAMGAVSKASTSYYSALEKRLTGTTQKEINESANKTNASETKKRPAKKKTARKAPAKKAS